MVGGRKNLTLPAGRLNSLPLHYTVFTVYVYVWPSRVRVATALSLPYLRGCKIVALIITVAGRYLVPFSPFPAMYQAYQDVLSVTSIPFPIPPPENASWKKPKYSCELCACRKPDFLCHRMTVSTMSHEPPSVAIEDVNPSLASVNRPTPPSRVLFVLHGRERCVLSVKISAVFSSHETVARASSAAPPRH